MKIFGIDYKYLAKEYLKQRDSGLCQICNEPLSGETDFDHIVPVRDGGSNDPENIRVVHASCHKVRHAQMRSRGPLKYDSRFYTGRRKQPLDNARRLIVLEMAPKILMERAKGKSISMISREMRISRPTIYEYLRKYKALENIPV